MDTWEYSNVRILNGTPLTIEHANGNNGSVLAPTSLDAFLTTFGSQGWEMVEKISQSGTTSDYKIRFKRRVLKYPVRMFLGQEKQDETALLFTPDSQGLILGQLQERPQEQLAHYLDACKMGRLIAFIDNKRYKITEFRSTGEFKAEPDFE